MQLRQAAAIAALSVAPFATAFAYPQPVIHNRAPWPAMIEINYAGCKNDKFRVGASRLDANGVLIEAINQAPGNRGGCLITWISATFEGNSKPVTRYTSSGTGYSEFIIAPTNDDFRVYSDAEIKEKRTNSQEGKSPGFAITNNTDVPVGVALSQVSCLYYKVLQPGETFNRNTGAVWFTIRAHPRPPLGARDDCYTFRPVRESDISSLSGQYAGPDWPFRCNQKPTYSITGAAAKQGLKITKTNTCGNKMMM